jgi:hypothetical protein
MHTLAQLRSGELAGIRRLDLSCGLDTFPEEIFSLADGLEVLNLTGNALSSLPADLDRLYRLQVLFCSNNRFTELPPCIGRCATLRIVGFKANRIARVAPASLPSGLRWLILTDNLIEQLPETLGECRSLQKLMLAGNRLQALPQSLVNCEQLELLRIAANQLTELPEWLLRLPALAWLAFAGNPLCAAPPPDVAQLIPWQQLRLQQQLGEGASGVIQQAQWQAPGQPAVSVAVKLYKGDVTSDGSPLEEMAACIAAGDHEHLICVKGRIVDHPQDVAGLVMALVDPALRNLADPPSLQSCSRDVYAQDLRLSPGVVLRLAQGIADACAHLHEVGMTHGDLYGHNILYNAEGHCLLGDFGAASFFPDAQQGQALQRIETRAFGILLGELMSCCAEPLKQLQQLQPLQAACIQPDVSARPTLREIARALSTFEASPSA